MALPISIILNKKANMPRGQLSFFKSETFSDHARLEHGGAVRAGKRKLARPIDTKRPMHLVLRSSKASGSWSFLKRANAYAVKRIISHYSRRFNVKVYDLANSGNHLHLIVRANKRREFQAFLRTISAIIARNITGAKKGQAKGKFWDTTAFSRVLNWGRAYSALKRYLSRNRLEAIGFFTKADRALSYYSALAQANKRAQLRL